MDGMVEENGTAGNSGGDPLAHSPGDTNSSVVVTSVQSSSQQHRLVAATSIVQLTLPTHVNNNTATAQLGEEGRGDVNIQASSNRLIDKARTTVWSLPHIKQVQSVIQPNQQSVIQTPTNIQPVQIQKGNVILVSKPNSVIQTTPGSLQTLQVVETGSDDSLSNDDESTKKRRDILSRRPSYRKILNDLGGGEIAVIPGTIQIASQGESVQGLHTLTMTNASTGGAIVHYASQGQDGQFFVPVVTQGGGIGGGPIIAEDQARKREMRLLKNREAARECRRKKKEYIKCLENRVAVLENQNKALIDELKSLKELYCQQKTE